jgi:hypothetical protein
MALLLVDVDRFGFRSFRPDEQDVIPQHLMIFERLAVIKPYYILMYKNLCYNC